MHQNQATRKLFRDGSLEGRAPIPLQCKLVPEDLVDRVVHWIELGERVELLLLVEGSIVLQLIIANFDVVLAEVRDELTLVVLKACLPQEATLAKQGHNIEQVNLVSHAPNSLLVLLHSLLLGLVPFTVAAEEAENFRQAGL